MAKAAGNIERRKGNPWRIAGWGIAAGLLLLPWIADAPWSAFDFVFAGVLIGGVGVALELTIWLTRDYAYRAGVALTLAATFLTIWANGAVGMIGDEDNPYNLIFLAVIALALLGAVVARFRASGMAVAMALAALVQFVAGAAGAFQDLRGGIFSAMFAGLWILAAALFAKSARDRKAAHEPV